MIKHVSISSVDDWGAACLFGVEQAERARAFHAGLPSYSPTALRRLSGLAEGLGLGAVFVKDESTRFGLNAFKGLGGSYCVARLLADRAGVSESELTFARLQREDVRQIANDLTLVTATDGNHGRGIAWTARELGCKAVVYMPKGSSSERLGNIRALGAQAEITELNYDDTVRLAARRAQEHGWELVQDTAWEGYEEIPTRIMQGYTTLALESVEQLDGEIPTHVILQAGVGAMSGAVAAFFADRFREARPTVVVVEPNAADCVYRTAVANDGELRKVEGDLGTIMAGLSCGEPCTVGWEMLRRYADHFLSVPDEIAEKGMRILARPVSGDAPIVSGESGAVTIGILAELMENEQLAELREAIGLGPDSKVLCISTEGDTDRESYSRIVYGIQ
ncbi:MAG: diaminopropionate ammonia-lyase [Eggerthellaceae bacterium]|nr:diaminopropionate ammonia-lyase [Eggerthellaceae bacterium]